MRRLLLLVVLAALFGLWWKRDDAVKVATEAVPALKGVLTDRSTPAKPVVVATAAVPVVVAYAARKSLPVTIEAVGTVQAIATVPIKPRIDSQIETVAVAEGSRVKEGDLLFTLDARALRAQIAQVDALIERDRAQIEQSRRDLARSEDLLAKRISTEVQRDTASTQLKVLGAQLAADQAQRANLVALLSYTEIRSPVSGRLGAITLKAGTTVRAADAQAIATVNQIDPVYVTFAVPQTLFPELRRAISAGPVKVEARLGNATASGTVAFVENAVDIATGTILAKALVSNADETLWPGTFVTVRVVLGVEADALAIPSASVQIGQSGAYVFVVREGRRAQLVPVTVARTVAGESVIGSGLSAGDQVVVDGQLRLVNNVDVTIQPRGNDGVAGTRGSDAGERRS